MAKKVTIEKLAEMVAKGFNEQREHIDKRFEQVDRRFDGIDGRLLRIDARLDLIEIDLRTQKAPILGAFCFY